MTRLTVMLPPDLAAWIRDQPGGTSAFVRSLVQAVASERDMTLILDHHVGQWHASLQTFSGGPERLLKGDGRTLGEALAPITGRRQPREIPAPGDDTYVGIDGRRYPVRPEGLQEA